MRSSSNRDQVFDPQLSRGSALCLEADRALNVDGRQAGILFEYVYN